MATVREGNKGVLLVVDVQVGVVNEAWDAPRIIGNVSLSVARARAQGVPVIWVQHSDKDLRHGSPEWQWVPELAPAAGEPLIHKHLQLVVRADDARRGARQAGRKPHRAGRSRDQLVHPRHGVRRARARLRSDSDQGRAHDRHHGARQRMRIEAASVIQDLNIAMKWLSYPGRTNGTATAEGIDFAIPGGAR